MLKDVIVRKRVVPVARKVLAPKALVVPVPLAVQVAQVVALAVQVQVQVQVIVIVQVRLSHPNRRVLVLVRGVREVLNRQHKQLHVAAVTFRKHYTQQFMEIHLHYNILVTANGVAMVNSMSLPLLLVAPALRMQVRFQRNAYSTA